MSGVLLVTGSISPTMVLNRTMASSRLTPEVSHYTRLCTVCTVRPGDCKDLKQ